MELILADPKLLAAILGPICVAVGYFYRSRKEKGESLKKALYQLLELWHRMSVLVKVDFDAEFEAIHNELCRHAPESRLVTEQMEQVKRYCTPILLENIQNIALSDFSSFEEEFNSAVCMLSKDDPIFAYKIRSVSKTKKFIKSLDDYLTKALAPLHESDNIPLANRLTDELTHKAKEDAVRDLERDIKSLSWRISVMSYIRVKLIIYKRHRMLVQLHKPELDQFVKDVLVPLMAEFNKPQEQSR
uniref:Uncharacterized protein n=1 Tax=Geobacter sp. (strain M21) TaxID=443144 RepID=C6DYH6_GEOSM